MFQNKALLLSAVALVVLLAGLYAAATMNTSEDTDSDQVVVGATIFPLADITKQIGGDNVRVVTIVPPGASPHSYSITPQQIADLTPARLIFKIGHNLDDPIAESIAGTHDIQVVTVDDDIELITFGDHGHKDEHADDDHDNGHEDEHDDEHDDHEDEHADNDHAHDEGDIDPHYWLDVHNAEQIAKNVANHLTEIDPDNMEVYATNLEAYLNELAELDQDLKSMAEKATQEHFIAMHDSWSYFASHYGFELVATYEAIEGKQPSASDLNNIKQVIDEHNITVFYSEPQKASSAATRFLSQEFDLKISILDPIGGLEDDDSYVKLMRRNMEALLDPK